MSYYGEYTKQVLSQISIVIYMAAFLMVFYYAKMALEAYSTEEIEYFEYQSRPVT